MGLLMQNISKYAKEYEAAGGVLNLSKISSWFENQKAIKRNEGLDEIDFEPKSAVMFVGVSGIGKSAFVEEFSKKHPEFEVLSSDEFYYQARDLTKTDIDARSYMNQLFEKKLRNVNRQEKSIIVEGTFINFALRAAILNTLRTLGYKVYLMYFTLEYANSKIRECSYKRAVELYFYNEYLEKNPQGPIIKKSIEIRKKIMEIYSEKLGMSIPEIYEAYKENSTVEEIAKKLVNLFKQEVKRNYVKEQEENGIFILGAHYYYEIQTSEQ